MFLLAGCQPSREERRRQRMMERNGGHNRSFSEILQDGFRQPVPVAIFLSVVFVIYIGLMMLTRANVSTTFPPSMARFTTWLFLTLTLLYLAFVHYGGVVHPGLPLLDQLIVVGFVCLLGLLLWMTAKSAAA